MCYMKHIAGDNETFIWNRATCKACCALGGVSWELARQVFQSRYDIAEIGVIACGFTVEPDKYVVYMRNQYKVRLKLPKK